MYNNPARLFRLGIFYLKKYFIIITFSLFPFKSLKKTVEKEAKKAERKAAKAARKKEKEQRKFDRKDEKHGNSPANNLLSYIRRDNQR